MRTSVADTLNRAYEQYQIANRSNPYSVEVDGMQSINRCCGRQQFSDFPRPRLSGLVSGRYPGSCCGKSLVGVDIRSAQCEPEEIRRAQQATGCVHVIADHYQLVSLVVVPVSSVALLVNLVMVAVVIMRSHQRTGKLASSEIPSRISADSHSLESNVKRLNEPLAERA